MNTESLLPVKVSDVIHAGRTGDAHSLFMNKKVVAIGFTRMGVLSTIPATRDALKAAVAKAYFNLKPG
jgi:restriction system protein